MLPLVRTTRKGSCDVRSLSGESMCAYSYLNSSCYTYLADTSHISLDNAPFTADSF